MRWLTDAVNREKLLSEHTTVPRALRTVAQVQQEVGRAPNAVNEMKEGSNTDALRQLQHKRARAADARPRPGDDGDLARQPPDFRPAHMVMPPSTTTIWPVVHLAAGEDK